MAKPETKSSRINIMLPQSTVELFDVLQTLYGESNHGHILYMGCPAYEVYISAEKWALGNQVVIKRQDGSLGFFDQHAMQEEDAVLWKTDLDFGDRSPLFERLVTKTQLCGDELVRRVGRFFGMYTFEYNNVGHMNIIYPNGSIEDLEKQYPDICPRLPVRPKESANVALANWFQNLKPLTMS